MQDKVRQTQNIQTDQVKPNQMLTEYQEITYKSRCLIYYDGKANSG